MVFTPFIVVDDGTNTEDVIEKLLEQCPIPGAAGHVTVSLISIVAVALISVFAVNF